jgi:hypothetical protein
VSEKYHGEKFKEVDGLFYKVPPYNIPDASSMKEGGPAPILYEKREVVACDDDLPVDRLLARPVSELRQDFSGKQCHRDYLSALPIPTCDEEGCSMDCDENTYVEDDILENYADPFSENVDPVYNLYDRFDALECLSVKLSGAKELLPGHPFGVDIMEGWF